jgi:hypothetical protein
MAIVVLIKVEKLQRAKARGGSSCMHKLVRYLIGCNMHFSGTFAAVENLKMQALMRRRWLV